MPPPSCSLALYETSSDLLPVRAKPVLIDAADLSTVKSPQRAPGVCQQVGVWSSKPSRNRRAAGGGVLPGGLRALWGMNALGVCGLDQLSCMTAAPLFS